MEFWIKLSCSKIRLKQINNKLFYKKNDISAHRY